MGQVIAAGRVLGGRYRIDEPLGVGGMARVWRGQDLRLGRPVAVKELAWPWPDDPTGTRRFDREARIGARLAHKNIVAVYDIGGRDGSRYLVMELVEGQTVADMLAAGPMPVDRVVGIAIQTCDGLAAAHEAGVVHRDIKPANLMVTSTGVVKICDFGIAKASLDNSDTNLTGPIYALGTSKFMAPEQPYGHIDARTDLYALGCTIYAMLTGDAPFDGRDSAEILQKHRNQLPIPLREQRADVSVVLESLVAQLLAKPADARPACATEVKARLEATEDHGASIATRRQTSAPPTTRPAAAARNGRHVRPVVSRGLVAAAALVVVAALAFWWVAAKPASVEAKGLWIDALPSPTASASASATPSPAVTPSPVAQGSESAASGETATQVTSPAPPTDPIANLRLSIQQQVNSGNLNPDKASGLYAKVDGIAQALHAGNLGDASHRVQDFRNMLLSLLNGGQLTAAGYDALVSSLDAIPLT